MKILLYRRPYTKPGWHAWKADEDQPGLEFVIVDANNTPQTKEAIVGTPLWRIDDLLAFIDGSLTVDSVLAGMPDVFPHLKRA